MAYLGYSDEFELDDDGILRDSMSSGGGILIDDDGIIRDSFDTQSKYTAGSTGTHWTDSGLERDKQSAGSSSTLRHSDLHSFASFDDVSHPLGENANISDLEASKDDLSFDRDSMVDGDDNELDNSRPLLGHSKLGERSLLSSNRSSFDHSLAFETTDPKSGSEKDLFDPEYYKQLQELGVLVDGAEFENTKNSLNEFEELEAHVSRDNIELSDEGGDSEEDIEEFLRRTPTREQLLGDYIGHRHGERYHDTSRDSRDHDDVASRTRPSTANSARTIGSEPFPEISPEEALQLYQDQLGYQDQLDIVDNDAESIEFQESQQTPQEHDDDEIFIITSRISDQPSPAKIKAYQNERNTLSMSPRSLTPKSNHSSRPTSRVSDAGNSRGNTPYRERQGYSYQHERSFDDDSRREGSVTPVSAINSDSRPSTRQGSRSGTPLQRPDSAASQRSAASERYSPHSKSKQSSSNQLAKSRSQESFFEKENESPAAGRKQGEKMPKRLLPKPSEVSTPLKVKSKSTTNISSGKSKPMKPKYSSMSMSLVNIDIGEGEDHSEGISASSDKSRTELSSKLHQEFNKRKQATELVQQLQLDYDKLLSKYAQAELTIDQLRLGANVTLHTNSPTPIPTIQGVLPSSQQPQTIQMGQMGRGVKSPSPFQGSLGVASPISLTESSAANVYTDQPDGRKNSLRGPSPMLSSGHSQTDGRGDMSLDHGVESVKAGLSLLTRGLNERMESFQGLLEAGEGMRHEDQEKIFDQIRNDHEKLRKNYLQTKEEYNTRKRTSGTGDVNFDEDKELEGELFRLGMKFDGIHEKMEENRKKQSQKQPFQSNRRQSDSDVLTSGMSDQEMRSVDHMKRKIKQVKAGNDLVQPKPNKEFEKNLEKLHVEYNALMDRYRRLKQMAQTPERDQEIDNLVRKLHEICQQEPEVFKMPQELEDRWQHLEQGDNDSVFSSRRQSPNPQNSRRPSKEDSGHGSYARTEDKQFTRDPNSSDHTAGSSRSLHTSDLDPHSESLRQMRESSMSGSRSSLSSRGRSPRDSTFDRDSPTPRLPRPRRHDHREPRSGNLKKRYYKLMSESGGERPESGSYSSLQDSGISDQEGSRTRERGATGGGPLSNLPGPGTFKQMTKQRHTGDADSGFIGSMVGSEVSGQQSARQQQQQQTLRLRHSDSGSERPRSRSSRSSRADDSLSVASSRTGHKQERPPSRESARSGRKSNNQSRDYTDDSYTLTESEMSFDIPETRPRRSSRDVRSGRRSVDLPIKEEEEERPKSTQSQGSKRGQRIQETPVKTPKKPAKTNVSFSEFSDEELTPRANRSYNDSREILSSEEVTPREQPIQPEERMEAQRTTVTRSKEKDRPLTPGAKKEPPRPPTPKIPTPRSDRSGTSIRRNQVPALDIPQPRSREEVRRPLVEDRGAGSDSDDTARVSVATAATKGSDSSEKFKLLQAEIGRLREEFQKAARNHSHPPPQEPPPPQPAPTREEERDRYFDPTEDPYAFMMGPRRRANSFSGAGARDWNDWWKYPPNQQQDDIPLGYAAADSFNPNRQVQVQVLPEPPRSSEKKRMKRKYRNRATGTEFQEEYDSDQSPSRVTASTANDEQLYSYYIPRYQAARTQTHQQPVRIQRYASQPNLLQNVSFQAAPRLQQPLPQHPPPPPPQYPNVPIASYAAPISAGYTRLRSSPRRRPTQPVYQAPHYSYDDLDMQGQQPIGYLVTSQPPPPQPVAPPVFLEQTSTCPMCGGSGVHSHGEYVYEAPPNDQPVAFVMQTPPRGRARRRSKSASRVRHYSPDGRNRSRYLVREYLSDESSSAESEDDIVYRRRSRSAGRRSRLRTRQIRKYKKSCEFENDLEISLNLTEEIDELTQKLVGTVKSELALSRRKDFGSSYW